MKPLNEVFYLSRLQGDLNNAVSELSADAKKPAKDQMFLDGETSQYIVSTIVSSGAGRFSMREFMETFYTDAEIDELCPPMEDDVDDEQRFEDDIYTYFAQVSEALEPLLNIPESFSIYIGFNENDGAIELWAVMDHED